MMFGLDVFGLREEFPSVTDKQIYFDNACMTLKPQRVMNKIIEYYTQYPGCAGRSSHTFARAVTEEVTRARRTIRKFVGAGRDEEIIFTKNTTEGINLLAHVFNLKSGDEVIISDKEHNSNLIPWLRLKEKGVHVKVLASNPDNTFNLEGFENAISTHTKLVSLVHTSNLDGVTNPLRQITRIAHKHNVPVIADGAQYVPSHELDVKGEHADFYVFSGHKMCGPTGTGVLYGKKSMLEELDQFLVGGDTVKDSKYAQFEPEALPHKFEAGLQNYAGILGLGEACRFLQKIGMNKIAKHETKLNTALTELCTNDKIHIIGPHDPKARSGIFSFYTKEHDAHHIAGMLDSSKKIMVRSGAHCVHSWFNKHQVRGSVRASMYLYNTEEEVQTCAEHIKKIIRL